MLVPPGRYPIDMLAVSLPVRRSELRDPVDAGCFCLSLLLLLLSDVTTSIDSLLVFWPFFVLNLFPCSFQSLRRTSPSSSTMMMIIMMRWRFDLYNIIIMDSSFMA